MTAKGNPELDDLLAAAAAAPQDDERDERDLAPVLLAFTVAGRDAAADEPTRGRAAGWRPGRMSGRLAVKCAAALLAATACGVAAAGANVLPTPVQQLAHDLLGRVGVPAPRTPGTTSSGSPAASATGTPTASPTPAADSGSAAATPDAATVTALCGTIAHSGNKWRTELDQADQATLIAAAGSENKVVSYCARLLSGALKSTATASAGTASAAASADATATHGKAHASHTPNPHSTAH
jgi:hypothetical protein